MLGTFCMGLNHPSCKVHKGGLLSKGHNCCNIKNAKKKKKKKNHHWDSERCQWYWISWFKEVRGYLYSYKHFFLFFLESLFGLFLDIHQIAKTSRMQNLQWTPNNIKTNSRKLVGPLVFELSRFYYIYEIAVYTAEKLKLNKKPCA